MRTRWWWAALVVPVVVLAGCTAGPVEVTGLPSGAPPVADLGHGDDPDDLLRLVSDIASLGTGSFEKPTPLTVSLRDGVDDDEVVVAAMRAGDGDPWTYRSAALTPNRDGATVTTDRRGQLAIMALDVDAAARVFVSAFDDRLAAGGAALDVDDPTCTGTPAAGADGYRLLATTGDTVASCFGSDATTRTLVVTNRRAYPVHLDLDSLVSVSVVSNTGPAGERNDYVTPASDDVVLLPGGTARVDVELWNLPEWDAVSTHDDFATALVELQAGAEALTALLGRFHAAGVPGAGDAAQVLAADRPCRDAAATEVATIGERCMSADALRAAFQTNAAVLAPVVATDAVRDALRDRSGPVAQALAGRDAVSFVVAQPTLGRLGAGGAAEGVGEVEPADVAVDPGEPTTHVRSVFWTGWGGAVAAGRGEALWAATDDTEDVEVRAYDLGTCDGRPAYLHLAVWFPQHGETFDPAHPSPGHGPAQALCDV